MNRSQTSTTVRCLGLFVAVAALLLLTACPDPPTKAIEDAERALLDAASVSECAEVEFRDAEQTLAEAKRLVEEGEYEAAEVKANMALTLAQRAKATGEANWDECQEAKNKDNLAANEGTTVNVPSNLELQIVYFNYNESTLTEQAKAILQNNAEWMRHNGNAKVQIEGHCDERGSTEYNLALGERRAQSVRKYLMQLGIDGNRMNVLSWGEERPATSGNTEDAFSKNRRAEFIARN